MCVEPPLNNAKLFNLEEAVSHRKTLTAQSKKLVLTNGCFDLLHIGHLYFLQQAATLGDALWIALNSDTSVRMLKGASRPVVNEQERAYALAALECIQGIIIFQTANLAAEIRALQPDFYTKAGDYSLDTINREEKKALEEVGATIHFLPFLKGYSTTSLIDRINLAARSFDSQF